MADRLLGALSMVVAAAMAWAARDYAAEISYEPVGPRAFPMLLAALMGLVGLWLLLRPVRLAAMGAGTDTPSGRYAPVVICAVAVLVYGATFEWLGFWLATVIMTLPVGLAFGARGHKALLGGVFIGLGMYWLFDKLLDVVLPTGLMAFVLGGR
jgi:putative tricarboxylic transport membrane protein